MSDNDTTPIHVSRRRPTADLATTLHELSCELAALRQEMRGFRDSVREVRTQVDELREKNEQVVVLRTQFRILWAVAATAGASGLGALVLDLIRLTKGATP
jgi:septal ring factor EnvC (AmiA/AmiB activator)